MIIPPTTTALEIITSAAVNLDYDLNWTVIDKTGPAAVTYDSATGQITTATTTSILATAAAAIYRVIESLSLRNVGGAAQTVTVQKDVSGANRVVFRATLQANEGLHYEDGKGWYVTTALGEVSFVGATGADGADGVLAVQEATVDFGSSFADTATVTVVDASVGTGSLFLAQISGGSTADNDSDVHRLIARFATVTAIPTAGQVEFRVDLDAMQATGDFEIRYTYSP